MTESNVSPVDDGPVLDGHAHAFPDAIAEHAVRTLTAGALWQPVQPRTDGTVGGLLASMDRAGIHRTIICSIATRPTQVTKITDWSVKIASDRIVPFASIHPDYEQPEAEAERVASLGLPGLKFHSQYMNCPPDDPRTIRIARAAARCGLGMVFHAGYDVAYEKSDIASPQRIRNLIDAVPDLRLMACHLGGWHAWEESLELLIGLPIYIETSYCLGQCPPEMVLNIIEKHAPELLLFGTDSPWMDQTEDLARFRTLPLDRSAMRQALWVNGNRFAGIEG